MKTLYIAGAYRGETSWIVEQNIRRAEETGFAVAQLGIVPVIPHTMYRYWDRTLTDDFWLKGTAELLRRCDGIVMAPGWSDSAGSRQELAIAREKQLPVFMATDANWLELVRRWAG